MRGGRFLGRAMLLLFAAAFLYMCGWSVHTVRTYSSVKRLVDQLKSSDEKVSAEAADRLAELRSPGTVDYFLIEACKADSLSKDSYDKVIDILTRVAIVEPDSVVACLTAKLPMWTIDRCGVIDRARSDASVIAWKALVNAGPPAVSALIRGLKNRDASIRANAAMALGEIGDRRAFKPLEALLFDEKRTASQRGRYAFGATVVDVRTAAGYGLGMLGAEAVEPLVKAAASADARMRRAATLGLGCTKDASAFDPLLRLLSDGDPEVRRMAAGALGDLRDTRAVEPLIVALSEDRDSEVRASAAYALGRLGDARAVDTLLAAASNAQGTNERFQAATALRDLKVPSSMDGLIRLLSSKDRYVRAFAVEALLFIGDTRPVPALVERLSDQDIDVVCRAAMALDVMGGEVGQKALSEITAGKDLKEIAERYREHIGKGKDGSEVFIVLALERYGSEEMARALCNSGHTCLFEIGILWARRRGVEDEVRRVLPSEKQVQWGTK